MGLLYLFIHWSSVLWIVLEIQQDTQLMRNEHPGAFASPLLPWKSDKFYIFRGCVCTLSYQACTKYLPHCIVICGLDGSTILFPHYIIKGTFYGKKLLNIKYVFWYSLQLFPKPFLILRRTERVMILNVRMWCTLYSCQTLMKLEYSGQICEKYPTIKFNENLSSGGQAVPCGRTDMTKLIVIFRNFANSPINSNLDYNYLRNWNRYQSARVSLSSTRRRPCMEATYFLPSVFWFQPTNSYTSVF